MQKIQSLSSRLSSFNIKHIPPEQNFIEDLLSKLATLKTMGFNGGVIQHTLVSPNIEVDEVYSLEDVPESSWMSLILHYLQSDELPLTREKQEGS